MISKDKMLSSSFIRLYWPDGGRMKPLREYFWLVVVLVFHMHVFMDRSKGVVNAFETFVSNCDAGEAAFIGSPHQNAGIPFDLFINDDIVSLEDAAVVLIPGESYAIRVEASTQYPSFKGIFIRLEAIDGQTLITDQTLIPVSDTIRPVAACLVPSRVGLSHFNAIAKTSVEATLDTTDVAYGSFILDVSYLINSQQYGLKTISLIVGTAAPVAETGSPTVTPPIQTPAPITNAPTQNPTDAPTTVPTPAVPTVSPRPTPVGGTSVLDVLKQYDDLSLIAFAVETSSLSLLNTPTDNLITFFAPNNDAMSKLDTSLSTKLLTPSWIVHLQNFILFHTVGDGRLFADDFNNLQVLNMINGENTTVQTSSPLIMESRFTERSRVVQRDLATINAAIHKVDAVLIPNFIILGLLETMKSMDELGEFVSLIELVPGLADSILIGDFTILAPSNGAFSQLPDGELDRLKDGTNVKELENLLKYHFIPTNVIPTSQFVSGELETSQGFSITIAVDTSGTVTFDDTSSLVFPGSNTPGRNGLVHVIDAVLIAPIPPPTLSPTTAAPVTPAPVTKSPTISPRPTVTQALLDVINSQADLSKFTTALQASSIKFDETPPYTVFAPIDDAFAALDEALFNKLLEPAWNKHLQNFINFHGTDEKRFFLDDFKNDQLLIMLNDEEVTLNVIDRRRLNLEQHNRSDWNHKLRRNEQKENNYTAADGPVTLKTKWTEESEIFAPDFDARNGVMHKVYEVLLPNFIFSSIYDTLNNTDGVFDELVSLIDLVPGLATAISIGSFTILAPTNDAFAALPSGMLEDLKDPANVAMLENTLLYHFIGGSVIPSDLLSDGPLISVQGGNVSVDTSNSPLVTFDGIPLKQPDYIANNGIIHAIDGVLSAPIPSPTTSPTTKPTIVPIAVTDAPTSSPKPTVSATILEIIGDQPDLLNFTNAMEVAQFQFPDPPYTVLAPTDDAISNINQDLFAKLLTPKWIIHLQNFLSFHVTDEGTILEDDFKNGQNLIMLNAEVVELSVVDRRRLRTQRETNIFVLQEELNTRKANKTDENKFSAADAIVTFKSTYTDSSRIFVPDLLARDGVVHKVTAALIPNFFEANLYEVLESFELNQFAELVDIVPGLAEILSSGEYTVFAPTDEAFNAIPEDDLESLKNDIPELNRTLLYHLIPNVIPSIQLTDDPAVVNVLGDSLDVSASGSIITINKAPINQADLLANNGIIHSVDRVLTIDPVLTPTVSPTTETPTSALTDNLPTLIGTEAPTIPETENPSMIQTSSPTLLPSVLLTSVSPVIITSAPTPTIAATTSPTDPLDTETPTISPTLSPTTSLPTQLSTVSSTTITPTAVPVATETPTIMTTERPIPKSRRRQPGGRQKRDASSTKNQSNSVNDN